MSTFTYEALNQLSQLPVGTVIMIGLDESVEVYKDSRDLEDGVTSHKFQKSILWVDKEGE